MLSRNAAIVPFSLDQIEWFLDNRRSQSVRLSLVANQRWVWSPSHTDLFYWIDIIAFFIYCILALLLFCFDGCFWFSFVVVLFGFFIAVAYFLG